MLRTFFAGKSDYNPHLTEDMKNQLSNMSIDTLIRIKNIMYTTLIIDELKSQCKAMHIELHACHRVFETGIAMCQQLITNNHADESLQRMFEQKFNEINSRIIPSTRKIAKHFFKGLVQNNLVEQIKIPEVNTSLLELAEIMEAKMNWVDNNMKTDAQVYVFFASFFEECRETLQKYPVKIQLNQ